MPMESRVKYSAVYVVAYLQTSLMLDRLQKGSPFIPLNDGLSV